MLYAACPQSPRRSNERNSRASSLLLVMGIEPAFKARARSMPLRCVVGAAGSRSSTLPALVAAAYRCVARSGVTETSSNRNKSASSCVSEKTSSKWRPAEGDASPLSSKERCRDIFVRPVKGPFGKSDLYKSSILPRFFAGRGVTGRMLQALASGLLRCSKSSLPVLVRCASAAIPAAAKSLTPLPPLSELLPPKKERRPRKRPRVLPSLGFLVGGAAAWSGRGAMCPQLTSYLCSRRL
jgi:hypothetical protein